MEETNHIKEILGKLGQVHEPIDLEEAILASILKEQKSKARIVKYRAQGRKSLLVSVILVSILGILFSTPNSIHSIENAIVTYTSIGLILVVLFFQMEAGHSKIFNHHKKEQS